MCARASRDPLDVARAFLSAGAGWLQLRCKGMDSGPFLALSQQVVEAATQAGAAVIVNDRADVAAMAGATGVHLGQDDLSPVDARTVIGAKAILGLSSHTREQWERAVREPITYLAIGPAFGTTTKATGYEAVGLHVVRAASSTAHAAGLPTVAIGGITLENAPEVIAAGASSVAVISDLLVGDPEARCRAFLRILA